MYYVVYCDMSGLTDLTGLKKIISFSLYGDLDRYCVGMIENIDIITVRYPDWGIHVYYHNIPDHILLILKSKRNTTLIECQSNGYKWEGMFWRFYPIESTDIDIFLSRDADSRISDREMDLINEWIESDKTFHIIRDHPGHRIEILGGTFGIKNKPFQIKAKEGGFQPIDYYKNQYYERYHKDVEKQPDQTFLTEFIYPLIKDDNVSHISEEGLRYSEHDKLIPKAVNFVGDAILHPSYTITEGLLYFHQGWTDIVNCLALINYYCRLYDIIYLLIRSESRDLIDFYTRDIENLSIIYIKKEEIDAIQPDEFRRTYKELDLTRADNLFIGGHDAHRTDTYRGKFGGFFVSGFYVSYDIPYITRISDFSFRRDTELENEVYDAFVKQHGTDYIVYHEVIENYDKAIPIVPFVNLDGISTRFLDMIKVLEHAREIHLLDSVWGALIYQLDAKYQLFKDKKVVLYAKRGYHPMFTDPFTLDNWTIV